MKNLANILRRADITPQERVVTLVQNDVYREEHGKSILSESEIYSLTQGWKPKNSYEVNAYNKYLDLSRIERSMRMDSHLLSLRSENSLLRGGMLVDSLFDEEFQKKNILDKHIPREDVIKSITENTYIECNKLVHLVTFNNMSDDFKRDLLLIDEYVNHDPKYFEDEVFLYELFNDSKTLTHQNKNLLINRIYSCIYHEEFRKLKNGSEKDGFLLFHFFAELPMNSVIKKWGEYMSVDCHGKNDVDILNELEKYAIEKDKTMESIIKDTLSRWLDEGLFVKEYTPLFFSNGYDTWNGNTKLKHKDIFNEWYQQLKNTEKYIHELSKEGTIEIKKFNKKVLTSTDTIEIVTGKSLNDCILDISFVNDYKKQVELLIPLAYTFLFIERYTNPLQNYATLTFFLELSNFFSQIFDIDMTARYKKNIESFEQDLYILNRTLSKCIDKINELIFTKNDISFPIEIDIEKFLFKMDNPLECGADDIINDYKKEVRRCGFSPV